MVWFRIIRVRDAGVLAKHAVSKKDMLPEMGSILFFIYE